MILPLASIVIVLFVTILQWYSFEELDKNSVTHHPHADILNPIAAALGGAVLAWAAFRQARNSTNAAKAATEQANTASQRHKEQTDADRQRRITESYSKAVEQLASEKIEARLGAIYTLERISKESLDDYWIVMETLTAFVRERAKWKEPDVTSLDSGQDRQGLSTDPAKWAAWLETASSTKIAALLKEACSISRTSAKWLEDAQWLESPPSAAVLKELFPTGLAAWLKAAPPYDIAEYLKKAPPIDIAAVLGVIRRRDTKNLERERKEGWRFELSGTDLRSANLSDAHLEHALLRGAHLEHAALHRTHLEHAHLGWTHFEGASLDGAYLNGAFLESANFTRSSLSLAWFEGTDLSSALGLVSFQLKRAYGDADTKLPDDVARPQHWSKPKVGPHRGGTP